MFLRKLLIILILISSTSLAAQTLDDLVFLTEEYAPLNYEEDGKLQGISVEVLAEMFRLVDAQKTVKDIKLWPWARGYRTVLNQKNTVLFSMVRTEARENLFKWVGPIVPSHVVIIAKKGRGIEINTPEDIGNYKVGVVREDVGEQLLVELGVRKETLFQTVSGISTAEMLHEDRIDMWAYEEIVATWNIRSIGGNPRDYEVIYSLKKSDYFFSFHRDTDDKIIARFQEALDELKRDGKFEEIVNKYIP